MSETETVSGRTTASPLPPHRLVTKLAEVMASISHVPKRGRNEFHKYDYAMEADIVSAIRQELASRRIMLFPSVVRSQRSAVGEKGSYLTELEMSFVFIDGETGESLAFSWIGAGSDKEDKGIYKAMTGSEKYFLLKTFLIPTGDDPEADVAPKQRQKAPEFQPADPNDQRPIAAAQIKRLKDLMRSHNTNVDEFKAWVDTRFGYKRSEEIQRRHYDSITKYIVEGVDTEVAQ